MRKLKKLIKERDIAKNRVFKIETHLSRYNDYDESLNISLNEYNTLKRKANTPLLYLIFMSFFNSTDSQMR